MTEDAKIDPREMAKIYFDMHKEQGVYIRHYEEMRFKLSQVILIITSVLIGFSKSDLIHNKPVFLLSIIVIALGAFGIFSTVKYSERADRHAALARRFRRMTSEVLSDTSTMELSYKDEVAEHDRHSPIVKNWRVRYFWVLLHAFVIMTGFYTLIL